MVLIVILRVATVSGKQGSIREIEVAQGNVGGFGTFGKMSWKLGGFCRERIVLCIFKMSIFCNISDLFCLKNLYRRCLENMCVNALNLKFSAAASLGVQTIPGFQVFIECKSRWVSGNCRGN